MSYSRLCLLQTYYYVDINITNFTFRMINHCLCIFKNIIANIYSIIKTFNLSGAIQNIMVTLKCNSIKRTFYHAIHKYDRDITGGYEFSTP